MHPVLCSIPDVLLLRAEFSTMHNEFIVSSIHGTKPRNRTDNLFLHPTDTLCTSKWIKRSPNCAPYLSTMDRLLNFLIRLLDAVHSKRKSKFVCWVSVGDSRNELYAVT